MSPTSVPPTNRPWLRWVIIGGGLLGIVMVLCCGFAVFGGFRLFQTIQAEQEAIKPTLRAFLTAGQNQDIPAALDLFSDTADQVSSADLERLFNDREEIFADYADVAIDSINISTTTSNGTTATVGGEISYQNGAPAHSYNATLHKDGTVWKLVSIQFSEGVGK